jgi:transitional endoplasmic reticulum ATPase
MSLSFSEDERDRKMVDEVTLKVGEAQQQDVGSGRARIDTKTRMALGVSPGDTIEIVGQRSTAAVVWRVFQADEGKGLLKVDGLIRKNAKVSIGDKVVVRKVPTKPASKVILAPMIPKNQRLKFGVGFENFIKSKLKSRPVTRADMIFIPGITLIGGALPFTVLSTVPKGIVVIDDTSEILLKDEPVEEVEQPKGAETYEDIGGLGDELTRVREMIELPLKHPELFERLGIEPPKGVLLFGPPGTGKTLIAKAVANESGANFFSIQGPEIMSKYYGESEKHLRKKFEEAEKSAPSIVFIDEIDSIAPKREDVQGEVERRIVAQLLTLMDGLTKRGNLIVIAATNRIDAVDPALRRPGRFDREIEIGVPDRGGREEILHVHTRGMPLEENFDISYFAEITHGFVGADLAALAREAAMRALRRYLPEIDLDKAIPTPVLEKMKITIDDFKEALKDIEPSALRDVFVEIPTVKWDDVGGLEDIKMKLKEAVELPLKRTDVFKRLGISPIKGVLLYGPPGTGKTLLAKAVASESQANFISIRGPEILSKWLGESEKAIREIFKKAKQAAPCIIFLDEIDSIAPRRSFSSDSKTSERVVNQLLTSMDGIEGREGVIVLAATNRPDMLDPGLLRPGRLDRLLMVPAPDKASRLQILKVHTKDVPLKDVDLEELAEQLEGYVGADICGLIREAGMIALRNNIEASVITKAHINEAIKSIRPSADDRTLKYYADIKKELEGSFAKRVKEEIGIQYR